MAIYKKLLGRLPKDKGTWLPGVEYKKENDVKLFNCVFRSKVDENDEAPATFDEENKRIVFNTAKWDVIFDGSSVWLMNYYKPEEEAAEEEKWNAFKASIENRMQRLEEPYYDDDAEKIMMPDIDGASFDLEEEELQLSDDFCERHDISYDEENEELIINSSEDDADYDDVPEDPEPEEPETPEPSEPETPGTEEPAEEPTEQQGE